MAELRWVLLGWAVVLGPGGVADIMIAPPDHRAQSAAVIVALAALVVVVTSIRPPWLAPGTAVLGLVMALIDPFTSGPWLWRATVMVADLALAVLGARAWLRTRRLFAAEAA